MVKYSEQKSNHIRKNGLVSENVHDYVATKMTNENINDNFVILASESKVVGRRRYKSKMLLHYLLEENKHFRKQTPLHPHKG